MVGHYLVVTLRRLRATPFASLANVLTLVIGLVCFLAAYGGAVFWRSGDARYVRMDGIFVVAQRFTRPGETPPTATPLLSSPTLAKYLKEDLPNVGKVARAVGIFDVGLVAAQDKLLLDAAFADPEFLDLFELEVVAGDARAALATPGAIILTSDAATRLFGTSQVMGRSLRVDDSWDATVAAVIAPIRGPSFMGVSRDLPLPFSMLAGWASNAGLVQLDQSDNWRNLNGFTFVSLPPTLRRAELTAQLASIAERRLPSAIRENGLSFEAFPVAGMTERRLNNQLLAGSEIGGSPTAVLLVLGILALVVACVSYASLGSAQSALRAKEIGVRRVLGAQRGQLLLQSWVDALFAASVAAVLALVVLVLAAPLIERWTDVDVLFFLMRGLTPWIVVVGAVSLVAIGAGAYPALVLSRTPSLDALHPGRSRARSPLITRLLVGAQFAGASFLLITVLVMQLERHSLERLATPSHADPIVVLGNLRPRRIDPVTLETALRRIPAVKSVAFVDAIPWSSAVNTLRFARSPGEGTNAPAAFFKNVSAGYFATLGLEVEAGRIFDDRDLSVSTNSPSGPIATDSSNNLLLIVDRTFAERLGFNNPTDAIDQLIYIPVVNPSQRPAPPGRIVGVTAAETSVLDAGQRSGYVYVFAPRPPTGRQIPLARISRENVDATVREIVRAWDELAPEAPASVRFIDDLFELRFRPYARTGTVILFLAASALAVSAIGQLGIAMHAVRRRRREMGLRRTMGSTRRELLRVLLIDFSKPVVIGSVIAWPFAYMAAQTYLTPFAHRIELTVWPFLASLGVTLLIAGGVVFAETWRAASTRPVDVLREV
jgi:putative ABC transport system permease protein